MSTLMARTTSTIMPSILKVPGWGDARLKNGCIVRVWNISTEPIKAQTSVVIKKLSEGTWWIVAVEFT